MSSHQGSSAAGTASSYVPAVPPLPPVPPKERTMDEEHSHNSRRSSPGSYSPQTGPGSATPTPTASSQNTLARINTVSYRNATIKAQIDTTMMVADVIRQLCANAHLGVQEPPALFALRDEDNDDLVDDSNLARKIQAGASFKLTASPLIEAAEMVDKLSSRDDKTLKMATYTLQRLIREPAFTAEFVRRGGVAELVGVVENLSSGNTLAYALTSCQNLLESGSEGWDSLHGDFVTKVVRILVVQERINVCRPATAILKKLVLSSKSSVAAVSQSHTQGEGRMTSPAVPLGFEAVYEKIRKEPAFLATLVHRLSSADTTLCLYSLSLLNSLMQQVTSTLFDEFHSELDKLGTSKAVARLMESNSSDELTASILEYQNNMIRVLHRRLNTQVTPTDKRHVTALTYIWRQARITDETPGSSPQRRRAGSVESAGREGATSQASSAPSTASKKIKWRQLGFSNENVAKDFNATGWLGLECCESFIRTDPDGYAQLIAEQAARSENRRCPWGKASTEVVEMLAHHWDIASGITTATQFTPFLLFFQRIHYLALRFFFRMWTESGAAITDFDRVAALVRSQVKEALSDEPSKTWADMDRLLLEAEYRAVRDRQIKELETEDDLMSKPAIRGLRARLYKENFEFMRQQRIQCLLTGAWFLIPTTTRFSNGQRLTGAGTSSTAPASGASGPGSRISVLLGGSHDSSTSQSRKGRPVPAAPMLWRFYRLSPNRRFLHYREATEPDSVVIRNGLDDLPERIDLGQVTDIALQSAVSIAGVATGMVGGGNSSSSQGRRQHRSPARDGAGTQAHTYGNANGSVAESVFRRGSLRRPSQPSIHHQPEQHAAHDATAASYGGGAGSSSSHHAHGAYPSAAGGVGGVAMDSSAGSTTAAAASSSSLDLKNSFSLLRSADTSLADLVARTSAQYSEWVDGLSMLRGGSPAANPNANANATDGDRGPTTSTEAGISAGVGVGGSSVYTAQTADYVQALTDIALKVKLLDLTGEGVDIPRDGIPAPSLPASLDFFFAEL